MIDHGVTLGEGVFQNGQGIAVGAVLGQGAAGGNQGECVVVESGAFPGGHPIGVPVAVHKLHAVVRKTNHSEGARSVVDRSAVGAQQHAAVGISGQSGQFHGVACLEVMGADEYCVFVGDLRVGIDLEGRIVPGLGQGECMGGRGTEAHAGAVHGDGSARGVPVFVAGIQGEGPGRYLGDDVLFAVFQAVDGITAAIGDDVAVLEGVGRFI